MFRTHIASRKLSRLLFSSIAQTKRGLQTLPDFSLAGKVCVVTGAARGLGKEFLTAFALSGAKEGACVDLSQADGEASIADIKSEAEAALSKSGGNGKVTDLRAYQCDVTSEEEVKRTFKEIVDTFGQVDVLVTSAGIVQNAKAEEYDYEKWKNMMNVNLNGTFLFAREAGQHMISRKIPGSIIMISSMSAFIVNRPQPQCAYNASKAAVSQLMRSMAAEWATYNIRVNALCPGYQKTTLIANLLKKEGDISPYWIRDTPMGRMCNPRELRGSIVFLASEASSFMTGHDMIVDGGYMSW